MSNRSPRKLIRDRIERNLNAISENTRRLEEIIGTMQDVSNGSGEYIEYEAQVMLVIEVTDTYRDITQKLLDIF